MKTRPNTRESRRRGERIGSVSRASLRTCVGCRQVDEQLALTRVTLPGGQLRADLTGRASGRGAYVHARSACLSMARKGGWERSFRTSIPLSSVTEIREQILNMTSEGSNE